MLSRKAERLASLVHTPQGDMGMGVFGVVVDDCDPFQLGLKISLHPSHQFPRVILKVDPVSELGRDDDFEEPSSPAFCHSSSRCAISTLLWERLKPAAFFSRFSAARSRAR